MWNDVLNRVWRKSYLGEEGFKIVEPPITSAYPENDFVSDEMTASATGRRSRLQKEPTVSSIPRTNSYLSAYSSESVKCAAPYDGDHDLPTSSTFSGQQIPR